MSRGVAGGQDGRIVLAGFANGDFVAHVDQGGGDVALAAVDVDVAVADDLPGLGAAGAEAHAVDHAVQAALQVLHQVLARDALLQRGLFEGVAELAFQHAVHAADFLLFAKLQAVAHDLLGAIFTVLSGDEVALFDRALLAVAAFAFEVQLHALAPALPANGANISCQVTFSLPSSNLRCGLQPWQAFFPLTRARTNPTQ